MNDPLFRRILAELIQALVKFDSDSEPNVSNAQDYGFAARHFNDARTTIE